jgi:hypothetical protein
MSMEDLTGTYEAVMFPDAYDSFAHIATRPGPFVVTGRVEEQLGGLAVNVSELALAGAIEHKSQPRLIALARK